MVINFVLLISVHSIQLCVFTIFFRISTVTCIITSCHCFQNTLSRDHYGQEGTNRTPHKMKQQVLHKVGLVQYRERQWKL